MVELVLNHLILNILINLVLKINIKFFDYDLLILMIDHKESLFFVLHLELHEFWKLDHIICEFNTYTNNIPPNLVIIL